MRPTVDLQFGQDVQQLFRRNTTPGFIQMAAVRRVFRGQCKNFSLPRMK
jgi:hypothetical protein